MRFAFASRSIVMACTVATACTATTPSPLPPRRVFAQEQTAQPPADQGPGASVARPPDVALPARPPVRHERYLHWTLAADFASMFPLMYWMAEPQDEYLVLPSLLLPPLIHVAHGEGESAVISLMMRVAMVGGVYYAGRLAESECAGELVCLPLGSMLLAQLAITPVVLIDSLLLARRVREDSSWRRLPVLPSVSAAADGRKMLSISAQF